ncbi:MAG: cell division protein SepF, partial [Microbacteriaceae bacterium]|nr:cell division protein SepF [Microbacteriaceae bacterium]
MAKGLKKAMVYLGLAEEDTTTEQQHTAEKANKTAPVNVVPLQAVPNVAPLHRATPTYAAPAQPMSEILTVHPVAYREAPQIAESFREGVPVIMNIARMDDAEARRIVDFASGLVSGLNGRIERVTGKVFLLTPAHISVGEPGAETHAVSGSIF